MGRLARYIFKMYGIHLIIVLVCILASVLCSLQGTMFMQNLIDDYITPMVEAHSVDFGPLLAAIGRVAFTHWAWYVPSFTTLSWHR